MQVRVVSDSAKCVYIRCPIRLPVLCLCVLHAVLMRHPMMCMQVRAVHDLLTQQPLPSGGYASGNRNALAALAFKALTGAPAVSLVTPGVTPQQAEATLKAQQLAALLRLCDELGAQADWIRSGGFPSAPRVPCAILLYQLS